MSNIAKKIGLITEFTCTSSVIFLTHPTVEKGLNRFNIKIAGIYTANKKTQESLWQPSDRQNVNNKEMQTLRVKLEIPIEIKVIKGFETYYPFSISDIKGLDGSKEDFSSLKNALPTLNKDAIVGKVYAIPDGLNEIKDRIPTKSGIRTAPILVKKFGFSVILYTKDNGVPVAERV
jgi:hypothetical protein